MKSTIHDILQALEGGPLTAHALAVKFNVIHREPPASFSEEEHKNYDHLCDELYELRVQGRIHEDFHHMKSYYSLIRRSTNHCIVDD